MERGADQLWNIADTLRGKMHADEFRDYILGFIFYKYLSEKMLLKANKLLETEDIKDYSKIDENTGEGKEILKHTHPFLTYRNFRQTLGVGRKHGSVLSSFVSGVGSYEPSFVYP